MDPKPDQPAPMPSTSLLRKWAEDPTNEQVWGLDAIADEIERLRKAAGEAQ